MPYVVPRVQSVFFDGTNNAEIEALITDPVWEVTQSNEDRIRWQSLGESEPYYRTVNVGEWLLYGYNGSGSGVEPIKSLTQELYETCYQEITP